MSSSEALPLLREQLLRLAQHRLGDPYAAEDVAQEALARVLESRQGFTSTAHLTGWAVTTTKNLCADHHRRQRHLTGWVGAELPVDCTDGVAADAFTLSRELVESILAALATMPDRQAAVLLTAARLGSADRTALAAATGETETAVRNYLHRGRTALRTKLAAMGQGAFGLLTFRSFLRSGAHRRALTASLLVPVLSLLTVLLRLPFHPQQTVIAAEAQSGQVAATGPRQLRTLPRPITAVPTTSPRPPGVKLPYDAQGAAGFAPGQTLPVLLMTHHGDVCGVRAGETVKAGRGDCGFDLSDESYVGVWVAGHGAGVYQASVRCAGLPQVPGVVCVDPSPSPAPQAGGSVSARGRLDQPVRS